MRRLRWLGHARPPGTPPAPGEADYFHETVEIGYRHHMNDLSAAIGIVQLGKLEKRTTSAGATSPPRTTPHSPTLAGSRRP